MKKNSQEEKAEKSTPLFKRGGGGVENPVLTPAKASRLVLVFSGIPIFKR